MLDWWHGKLPNSEPDGIIPEDHPGTLETSLINLNTTIGIADYWNLNIE